MVSLSLLPPVLPTTSGESAPPVEHTVPVFRPPASQAMQVSSHPMPLSANAVIYRAAEKPCLMLPRTGQEKIVFLNKASDNCSLRFHGNRETQRAMAQ